MFLHGYFHTQPIFSMFLHGYFHTQPIFSMFLHGYFHTQPIFSVFRRPDRQLHVHGAGSHEQQKLQRKGAPSTTLSLSCFPRPPLLCTATSTSHCVPLAPASASCSVACSCETSLYNAYQSVMQLPHAQVDIFSFGVILFEMFAKSVTGAALLTVGDVDECEMYAWKVQTSHMILAQAHPCSPDSTCRQAWHVSAQTIAVAVRMIHEGHCGGWPRAAAVVWHAMNPPPKFGVLTWL